MAVFLFALGLQYNNEKVAAFFVDALRSADGMREDRCVRAVPCRAVPCRRRGASCETGREAA